MRTILSTLLMLSVLPATADPVKVGVLGLDTSHSTAFSKLINDPNGEGIFARFEVVAAYPRGSTTIQSSMDRIPQYTEEMIGLGVEVVESIDELLRRVDVVLLETNDGKPHLEQALQVIRAGKPLFVDKPAAASLEDVIAIYEAAEKAGVPVFSSSSLRYSKAAQDIRGGSIGRVTSAFAYSPAPVEPSHPDLYWYGIHGVEALFTVMGPGCEKVVRIHAEGTDVVTCTWADGRIGTTYGVRESRHGYGGTAFGTDGIAEIGPYEGYGMLVEEILRFFETGQSPVPARETIEIYAFMSAADESKKRGGGVVVLDEVIREARAAAAEKLRLMDEG